MITIDRQHVNAVQRATTVEDLWPMVQSAIELEHSTIPPYLTALFSIKQGHNADAAEIIGSIVGQEMLHMAIVCNLLNAIGGAPDIDNPSFIPAYPGPLPMGVHGSLSVGLEKLGRRLVHDVFMTIEEPEDPIDIPVGGVRALASAAPVQFATIGEFYAAIVEKLGDLDGNPFAHPSHAQVADVRWYPSDQLFPIDSFESAKRAIDVIVVQGEGTRASPIGDAGEVAHYYRFAQIVYARRLVERDGKWSYSGAPVGIDPAGVWDLRADAKAADYPADSHARVLVDMFNAGYTRLLRCLHRTFNGEPDQLDMALSVMVELQLTAQKLVSTPVPGTSTFAGPTFEYAG